MSEHPDLIDGTPVHARHLIRRYRLLAELETWHTLEDAGQSNEAATIVQMLFDAERKAVDAAGQLGWLDGLEVRDPCCDTIGIVDRDSSEVVVATRDGRRRRLADVQLGHSCHFALPGSTRPFYEATLEALEARAAS